MTSIADSYAPIMQTDAKHGANETTFIQNRDEPRRTCNVETRKRTCLDRGRILSESARRYHALLPLAFSSFLGDVYKTILNVLKICAHNSKVLFG